MCCRLTINPPPLRRLETDVFAQRCALVVVHATIGLDWAPMYYPLLLWYAALYTQGDSDVISMPYSWWRGSVVERRSLAGELSLSCA